MRWTARGAAAVLGAALATGIPADRAFGAGLANSTPQSITTIAGNGTAGTSGDGGLAVQAELNRPNGVALDQLGNLYISDGGNNLVRKVVNPTTLNADTITAVAGTGDRGFGGDGGPAVDAKLNRPFGVAVDSAGDLFIADSGNNRVREVLPSGIITTFAGSGSCGKKIPIGDGLPAVQASLCRPTGVAVDSNGVYISDSGHREVRVVNAAGIIEAFAGKAKSVHPYAWRGDKPKPKPKPTRIKLEFPTGLAVDALHDVFITDTGASTVLEVLADGTIRTVAGTGKPGYSGDTGPATRATLNEPTGVGVDQMGNVYISDTRNNRLRQVAPSGVISTIAGTGRFGFSGDGGPATQARLAFPTGSIAASGSDIYFSDLANQRVRGVFTGPPPVLPQAPWAMALPLVAAALGACTYGLVRRRRRAGLSTA
jgi:hypothetical protein